jgi:PAS domain S-box-containing protein
MRNGASNKTSRDASESEREDEQCQIDDAPRLGEQRYRALVEATSQVVWSWSPAGETGDFTRTRQWWEDLTGQTVTDQLSNGSAWLEVVHEDDREPAAAAWATAIATGKAYDIEYRVRARQGGWRHVHARGVPLLDPDGTVREWIGTLNDISERRQVQEERERLLREVEAERSRLADVFQNAPSFLCVLLGPNHIFERANDRYLDLVDHRDIIGKPVREALPELETQGFLEILDRVYRTGEPYVGTGVPVKLRRGDSVEVRVLEFVYQPMRNAEGVVTGILAHGIDLTDRHRAENAFVTLSAEAERQRRMFETALSNTADFLYLFDREGRFTYVNKALLDLWQLDLARAVGKTFFELDYPPELAARLQNQIEQVFKTGQPVRDETPYTSAAGTRAYEYIFMPVLGAGGIVEAVAGSTRDITDRQHAAAALRDARERLEATLVAGEVATWTWDVATDRVNADRNMARLFGVSDADARGGPIAAYVRSIHPDDRGRVPELVRAAIQNGTPFEAEYRVLHEDGEYRSVIARGKPEYGPGGVPGRLPGVVLDITRQKKAEADLREADRKKNDFLALLAHELRNPLAPLRNGLQVLRLTSADADAKARIQAMMDRQLSHMVRLIDDLLDISRIERNKMELRRTRVLLADAVSSAVETARPLIDAAGHELTVSLPDAPIYLDADLTRLAQVFGNLLTNSAKYTERGGRIWLSAERRGIEVVVSVRDTGIGIPPESLANIFDMFSQVDRSLERSTGGLGIGLALVRGLVEMHGGTVTAESGAGAGSTFSVHLAVMPPQPKTSSVTASDNEPANAEPGRRILVVDDSRDGADSLAMMLRVLGNEVCTAYDGVAAVEQAEAFRPQVVLMDVGMPKLNGLDATRRIRGQPRGREMCIIALTGWGQEGDKELSREAGCDGHLVKPVDLKVLHALLDELQKKRL